MISFSGRLPPPMNSNSNRQPPWISSNSPPIFELNNQMNSKKVRSILSRTSTSGLGLDDDTDPFQRETEPVEHEYEPLEQDEEDELEESLRPEKKNLKWNNNMDGVLINSLLDQMHNGQKKLIIIHKHNT